MVLVIFRMKSETRKLQQVGHSTLMISLPKEWVRATNLSQGDSLTIQQNDDGTLNILPSGIPQKKEVVKCIVDSDKCKKPNLLTRIITGVYIIGHETLEIYSKKGFEPEHLAEIRKTIHGLTGMSIVEQDMSHVVIKNFVDPTRFPAIGLMRIIYMITSWMQEASIQALKENRKNLANEVIHMEKEVDRIYWLIILQLLLAAKDKSVEKKIGIESSQNIVGSRTVAKILEKIGDLAEDIAIQVITILDSDYPPDQSAIDDLEKMFKMIQKVYDESTKGFFSTNINMANDALENVLAISTEFTKVTNSVLTNFTNNLEKKNGRQDFQKIDTYLSLRTILWIFSQIAGYCGTISEITINRVLERPSNICKFEMQPPEHI